ncbi:MAG TPA: Wzz/FepE/Etk N-terminal domain-containing protein, partial [Gemmatimonadales bacterium]|nr:Wzz/FepE/Etk N-terminal domain-containing protein [Gemmatimonadales bacterium]
MERLPGPRRSTLPASVEAGGRLRDWPTTVREDAADTIDWRRTLATLWRGRFVILGLTLLGTLGGLWATRFFHPQYVARATIWIDESQHRGSDIGPIRSERLFDPEAWLDLIKSDAVLTPVVTAGGLLTQAGSPADSAALSGATLADPYRPGSYVLRVDPAGRAWTIAGEGNVVLDSGVVGDSVGRAIGLHWVPIAGALTPARTVTFTLLPAHDAARQLADQLQLHIDLNGSLLTLELAGSNPRRVTATVNAIAQRYIEVATGLQQQKLTELAGLLEDQRREAEQQLQGAETALERFRVQTITLPSLADVAPGKDGAAGGERDPAITSFFSQELERQSIQQDRADLEQVLAQSRDSNGISAERLLGIGAVQHSAELPAVVKELTDKQAQLRALQLRYGDSYPTIQRLTEDIQTLKTMTIPAAIRTLLAELQTRETQLA